jgi:uncharacterized protein (DUF1778 family)
VLGGKADKLVPAPGTASSQERACRPEPNGFLAELAGSVRGDSRTDVAGALELPRLRRHLMATNTSTREDRIELRTTKEEKRLLTTAAACERLDLTSFIMRTALPVAREVVDRAERISLSERDSAQILKLLENPPRPTKALLAAARRRAGK